MVVLEGTGVGQSYGEHGHVLVPHKVGVHLGQSGQSCENKYLCLQGPTISLGRVQIFFEIKNRFNKTTANNYSIGLTALRFRREFKRSYK